VFKTSNHNNLLPSNGSAYYICSYINHQVSDSLISSLIALDSWRNDEVVIFGKRLVLKRKIIWFADNFSPYKYSGIEHTPSPWPKDILTIKNELENILGLNFNSCLLNLYHNGQESMGWHADNEKSITPYSTIASISLGAERRFLFKHKTTKEKIVVNLGNGSLLLMCDEIQQFWLHALPAARKVLTPRINLTFRMMKGA
jgi:alkylated DNA repair dioxygenase AlkB